MPLLIIVTSTCEPYLGIWESSSCFHQSNKAADRERKELSFPPSSPLLPTAGHRLHCGRWDCNEFAVIPHRSVLSASCQRDNCPFLQICNASLTLSYFFLLLAWFLLLSSSYDGGFWIWSMHFLSCVFYLLFLHVLYSLFLSLVLDGLLTVARRFRDASF
jgi:hypothetical protein